MKDKIKEILRENMITNSLGVKVTRPTQELIVMRGIPGAGKSTKANSLMHEGVIHSTDIIIERTGDYAGFFSKMIESKDFTPLSRAHSTCFNEAVTSMKKGITPIVIDNTNIKMNEAKNYVKAALTLGYSDENIKFVDIGTAGLTAEVLSERNTHGVPLEKIKQMIESYKAQGEISLQRVLESKDMYKESDVLYSAVVLDNGSRQSLLDRVSDLIPKDWNIIAHHMAIVFGKPVPNKEDLGQKVSLTVTKVGLSDMAMAVAVNGYPSKNAIPHITIAVNPNGGKAVMSNEITKWQDVKPFVITGVVTEIKK